MPTELNNYLELLLDDISLSGKPVFQMLKTMSPQFAEK